MNYASPLEEFQHVSFPSVLGPQTPLAQPPDVQPPSLARRCVQREAEALWKSNERTQVIIDHWGCWDLDRRDQDRTGERTGRGGCGCGWLARLCGELAEMLMLESSIDDVPEMNRNIETEGWIGILR